MVEGERERERTFNPLNPNEAVQSHGFRVFKDASVDNGFSLAL
jgi:hypothetical protein